MGNSTVVCNPKSSPLLESRILRVSEVPEDSQEEMFNLFRSHYDCVSFQQFRNDISGKDFVILMKDPVTARICGFSTQTVIKQFHGRARMRVLFSGDTIIDPRYWGEFSLVKNWCRLAGAIHAEEPSTPLYWFLICKGYRTYLYLPLFFHKYYPRFDLPTPICEKSLMDAISTKMFTEDYNPCTGVIEFKVSHGQLAPELAHVPKGRLGDSRVQFFLDRNPGYKKGHELACLGLIHPENMKSFAKKYVLEGECLGLHRVLSPS